jgi:hypothetical protein
MHGFYREQQTQHCKRLCRWEPDRKTHSPANPSVSSIAKRLPIACIARALGALVAKV